MFLDNLLVLMLHSFLETIILRTNNQIKRQRQKLNPYICEINRCYFSNIYVHIRTYYSKLKVWITICKKTNENLGILTHIFLLLTTKTIPISKWLSWEVRQNPTSDEKLSKSCHVRMYFYYSKFLSNTRISFLFLPCAIVNIRS